MKLMDYHFQTTIFPNTAIQGRSECVCCVAVLMSSPFYVNHPAMASADTESIGNVALTHQILTAKTAKLLKIKTFL